jgi:nucleoside-diphosphate-sugar epimerase
MVRDAKQNQKLCASRVDDSRTELIVPAVRGTTSILNSALKYGTGVKRIVLTSSLAAIREADPNPRTYDETNWNNAAVTAVETKGSGAGPVSIYLASKTLAERAAWEFVAKHKAELKWDLVVLNPPWVFGVCRYFTLPPMAPK